MSSVLPDNPMSNALHTLNNGAQAAIPGALATPQRSREHAAEEDHAKEPGHPCSGGGRCCGGCQNPKRPVATDLEPLSPTGASSAAGESVQPLKSLSSSQSLPSSSSATD